MFCKRIFLPRGPEVRLVSSELFLHPTMICRTCDLMFLFSSLSPDSNILFYNTFTQQSFRVLRSVRVLCSSEFMFEVV